MAFEQFAKHGESNVFTGLFGAESDGESCSDYKQYEDGEDASLEAIQDESVTSIASSFRRETLYSSPQLGVRVKLLENPRAGIAHQLWPAAEFFCDFWERQHEGLLLQLCGGEAYDILELGAGIGLCGMFVASITSTPHKIQRLILTDLEEAIDGLSSNTALNSEHFCCPVEVAVLRWGHDDDLETVMQRLSGEDGGGVAAPKIVLATDCVYWESLFAPFCSTIKALAHRGSYIILTHVKRWKKDAKFFRLCKKAQLELRLLEENIVIEPALHTGLPEKKIMRIYCIHDPAVTHFAVESAPS